MVGRVAGLLRGGRILGPLDHSSEQTRGCVWLLCRAMHGAAQSGSGDGNGTPAEHAWPGSASACGAPRRRRCSEAARLRRSLVTPVLRTALIAVVAVAGALALWLVLRSALPQTATRGGPAAPAEAVPASPETAAPAQQLAQPAELDRYQGQNVFTDEVRDFFDSAEDLSDEERELRAAALRKRIAEQERGGGLLPAEALMLKLALLRVTIDDPAVLDHESRGLTESYQEAQAARAPTPADPRFETYKQRESEVVREVLALEEIPGGLTREEYLRRRLRDLRSEVYSGANAEPEPD